MTENYQNNNNNNREYISIALESIQTSDIISFLKNNLNNENINKNVISLLKNILQSGNEINLILENNFNIIIGGYPKWLKLLNGNMMKKEINLCSLECQEIEKQIIG